MSGVDKSRCESGWMWLMMLMGAVVATYHQISRFWVMSNVMRGIRPGTCENNCDGGGK